MRINETNEQRNANIVYKTFGSQWVVERMIPYQNSL